MLVILFVIVSESSILKSILSTFNPIRPRAFDALGSLGRGGADSASLIYICSGQPRALKIAICIEHYMVNPKLKSILDMSRDLPMTLHC